jgi:hypothetical protein
MLSTPRALIKRVVHRQDCIFLTSVFPMRAARVDSGIGPDGDASIAYPPPSLRDTCPADLSLEAGMLEMLCLLMTTMLQGSPSARHSSDWYILLRILVWHHCIPHSIPRFILRRFSSPSWHAHLRPRWLD